MKKIWAIAPLAAVLSACASYTPVSNQILQPKLSDWQVTDNLAAAVDPYLEADRQKAHFDADLTGANVLAVQIAVENRTDRAMLVRPSDIQLLLADGRAYAPANVLTTVSKVGESGSVVGAGLAFGLIGVIMAANAETEAKNARTADYNQKAFPEKYLTKGERSEGVVFFIPPVSLCDMEGATIRVKFVDPDSATLTTVDVPMPGGKYGQQVEAKPRGVGIPDSSQPGNEVDNKVAGDEDPERCAAL